MQSHVGAFTRGLPLFSIVLAACSSSRPLESTGTSQAALNATTYNNLNLAAGSTVLYEVQVRTANACSPAAGSPAQQAACAAKVAPAPTYHAQGVSCSSLADLESIRLGTIDDMLETTTDYESGITLSYVKQKLGATMVWVMPPFPDNDTWSIPDPCDNLGSPYAVRDYFHVDPALARRCIAAGAAAPGCWANTELDSYVAQAHALGLKVMLDIAFNHFGHNYLTYNVAGVTQIRDRVANGQDLESLWDFGSTYDAALLHPTVLDRASQLPAGADLTALQAKCPALTGDALVRAYNIWEMAFDWDRAIFDCTNLFLEYEAPGFYLGSDQYDPSARLGDDYSGSWPDVKFLFHHEENAAHQWEFVREREYLFNVMNYWVSRGVDGFRLDHATDSVGGLGSNEWKYLTTKVDYYASLRGQATPIYMAEEFSEQDQEDYVVDVETEGYVTAIDGRYVSTKNASYVDGVVAETGRFDGHAFVMTALEDHDEERLVTGTGFDIWTGAGFWGLGATTRSTPMILMGQELGESEQLEFRRSDYLRSRFVGSPSYTTEGPALLAYYNTMIAARLANENRALLAPNYAVLTTQSSDSVDENIFAAVKWSSDGNVVFVFHNLWEVDSSDTFFIPPDIVAAISLAPTTSYKLVDAISGDQLGSCTTGADLAYALYVHLPSGTRAQWARLETCD